MNANLERRLAQLEAKAKPPVIATWVDFILWLDEHENDEEDLVVELSPEFEQLIA
jgi:hypothetical protein